MIKAEIERRKDRDNKFWQHGTEFKSVAEQFSAIRAFDEIGREDPRLEQRTEGLSTDDFPIKTDLTTKLFQTGNVSELWTRALTIPIENYAQIKMPAWDETTRATGSLLGGLNFEWVEQGATIDYTNPKFRMLDMNLWKMMTLVPFTSEWAADATSFDTVMESMSSKGLNYVIEDGVIRGTGAGRPQGFLHSNCKIRCSKEADQDPDTITAENIFAMLSRIIPECWTNGDLVFLGHPSTLPQVSTLTQSVGTGGSINPLWHWSQGGERHNKLMGLDYIISDRCSVLGDEGDIILADLKSVVITYKPAKKMTSAHVGALFLTDEELLRITMRMNVQNILSRPIVPAQGSDTLSTVVTLKTRE